MTWIEPVARWFTPVQFIQYVKGLTLRNWRPSFCVVHHTGVPTLEQWQQAPGSRWMQGLARYYRDTEKWHAGPHLFVAPNAIWVFTPLTVPGVHSPSWNNVSWGIEMVGDYGTEALDPAVWQNTASALATLHDWAGLDPATLHFHKEDPKTTHKSCPGKNVKKPALIQLIQQKLIVRHGGEHDPTALRA